MPICGKIHISEAVSSSIRLWYLDHWGSWRMCALCWWKREMWLSVASFIRSHWLKKNKKKKNTIKQTTCQTLRHSVPQTWSWCTTVGGVNSQNIKTAGTPGWDLRDAGVKGNIYPTGGSVAPCNSFQQTTLYGLRCYWRTGRAFTMP